MKLRLKRMKILKITLIAAMASVCAAPAVSAQQVVGSWETISSYGGVPSRVIDTDDLVYVLSQGNLSSVHKKTGEVYSYGRSNLLNDGKIADIFYNHDGRYLLISYENDNIDVVKADGTTVGFPELMNASLTVSKKVRDVAFRGDKAYVATDFGIVVLDVARQIVEESGIYGFAVNCLAATGDRLFLCVQNADHRGTWSAPLDVSHSRFGAFTRCWTDYVTGGMESMDDGRLFAVGNSAGILTYDSESDKVSWKTVKGSVGATRPQRAKNGFFVHNSAKTWAVVVGQDGTIAHEMTLPEGVSGNALGCRAGDPSALWAGNAEGYGCFDLNAGAFSFSRVRPAGTSGPNVGRIQAAPDGSIYLMTAGEANNVAMAYTGTVYIDRLDPDGTFTNVSPLPAVLRAYKFAVDPNNPDLLSVGLRTGLLRLDAGTRSHTLYNSSNSAISGNGVVPMMVDTRFDAKGNVWALMHWDEDGADNLYFISRDAWAKGPGPDDIVALDFGTQSTSHSASLFVHSSGLILVSGNRFTGVYDPNGTPADGSDDRHVIHTGTTDADGMSLNGNYIMDVEEDRSGRLWLATNGGVRVIADPAEMFGLGWEVSRPKVARNDGTNLADFLLDNEVVTGVSVDANNCKWFSTFGSGIYHTNADGTEILGHYMTSNSGLMSDNVYDIFADPNSNDVYVGTDIGLCVYHSTSSPAAQSYSDVYAYPNPVTPDYTGLITITGLMDKSLVKIADSAGNVFWQTVSEGGMVVWDGCDASGSRVKSGVYFVFASQNASGSSSAVVTKILVIN